jgi:PAS domain S-box-containing protein
MQSTAEIRRDELCHWLTGGGEMGRCIRQHDWSATPLGPIEDWPSSLRTVVCLCVATNFPIAIAWGPEHIMLYNDGYRSVCGSKHALGMDYSKCWASAWPDIGEPFAQALHGTAVYLENHRMFLDRNGYLEETFFSYSFSPIADDHGAVGGVLIPNVETTLIVLSNRRTRSLRDLAARMAQAKTMEDVLVGAAAELGAHAFDVPFALFYAVGDGGARLVSSAGLASGTAASPALAALDGCGWPLDEVMRTGKPTQVSDLAGRFGPLRCGPYPESPQVALMLPIVLPGHEKPAAILIAGVSPRLPLNDAYRDFYALLAGAVTVAVADALAFAEERARAEALAELDRAKTTFFSNISHEFRTPLTLMLGPLDEALTDPVEPPGRRQRERLEIACRNCRRLYRLVDELLQFSRIEAGRIEVSYQPTDLSTLTAGLASNFRSACEKAGLTLKVDCRTLPESVYVDRNMWETIVLNLVSNAFKFTLKGGIEVALHQRGAVAELTVRDSGVGIPADHLPRLFERFSRVEGTAGRSMEGSGIGLALVRELVRLHGGDVQVDSQVGVGSVFTVTIPLGKKHLPADRIRPGEPLGPVVSGAAAYVDEALRWLPDPASGEPESANAPAPSPQVGGARPRILLADDNADMRTYVRRLLGRRYEIVAVANGAEALRVARENPPDLILADVMMPELDGFGLLQAVRADPRTLAVPVLLVSARAGEEARVEGMQAGADDYLTKPFSARELLARVDAHLALAHLRREAGESLRATEERFQAFMDNTPALAFIKDADGRYVFINRAMMHDFGFRETDCIGKTDVELFSAATAAQLREHDQAVLASRRPVRCIETVARDDGDRTYLSFKFPLQDRDGRWLLAGMSIDITEQKRTEEMLLQARERERELIGVVSHDLRNPLAAVLAYADLAMRAKPLPLGAERSLHRLRGSAERALRLLGDLLDFTQARTLGQLRVKPAAHDMQELLRIAVQEASLTHPHRRIEQRGESGPLAGRWDGDRVVQVLANLLDNALKFSPPDSVVTVETHSDGEGVRIAIHNWGDPIPPDRLASVFEPFQRADPTVSARVSLGLGLYISRQIALAHGGRLDADSSAERGTTFTLTLPWLCPSRDNDA